MQDIEIAKKAKLKNINEIAKLIDIKEDELEQYGKYKAKISLDVLKRLETRGNGKLVLVTAINPTPLGEGKSTVTIGLTQAFNKIGINSIAALREPSLGPVFGSKGGATGGGYAQVLPMEDINLHFNGDMHAISSAVNLISAYIDNHIYQGNELNIDPDNIFFKRAVDMNDRTLREIRIGMGKQTNGIERMASYQITVASEIMAILCLSDSLKDLKNRIENIVFGLDKNGKMLKISELNVAGAATVLLKDAIKPNLVQTIENTPVLIHGGPFANIAHGCNSLIATRMALKLSEYTITEAGFGADLGAEKFFDIKCRKGGLTPSIVVLVATVKALKYNGYGDLEKGLSNLGRHIENMKKYNLPIVVAINKFTNDTEDEIQLISNYARKYGVLTSLVTVHSDGGDGAIDLANKIITLTNLNTSLIDESEEGKIDIMNFNLLYKDELSIKEKIEIIAKEIYRASDIELSDTAINKIRLFEENGYSNLPICVSKTPASFTDDAKILGAPTDFIFHINDIRLSAGAGFIVAMSGNVIDMPGLPKTPAADIIDIDEEENIIGLS